MSSKTTISDVAKVAGASPSAVSFVLNGKADKYRISPATQARIRAAIQTTGYQPDPVARDIALGRSADYFAKMAESDLRHQTPDIRPETLEDQLSAEAQIPEPAVEDTPPVPILNQPMTEPSTEIPTPVEPPPIIEPAGEMPTPVELPLATPPIAEEIPTPTPEPVISTPPTPEPGMEDAPTPQPPADPNLIPPSDQSQQ